MRLATRYCISENSISIVDFAGNYVKLTKCLNTDNSLYFTNWTSDEEHTLKKLLKAAHRQQRAKQMKSYCVMGEGIQRKNTISI